MRAKATCSCHPEPRSWPEADVIIACLVGVALGACGLFSAERLSVSRRPDGAIQIKSCAESGNCTLGTLGGTAVE